MGKRGPQAWKPSDEERASIEHYVSLGYTQEQIGALMGKSIDTLAHYCRAELDHGMLKVNAKVGGALFNKAMGGDTAALIFWAKTRMGWKETDRHEHSGSVSTVIDVSSLSDEAKRELAKLKL